MKFLSLDDEQAALLVSAAECSIAFLNERSKRIDPQGLLSAAAELQANKLLNIKAQMAEPGLPKWSTMLPDVREKVQTFANLLNVAEAPEDAEYAWRGLLAAVVSARPSMAGHAEEPPVHA